MERVELLNTLALARPALADKPIVPIFNHFCFDGDTVTGNNDNMVIQLACRLGFEGAVEGAPFINWLKISRFKEVKFEEDGDVLCVRGGKSKVMGSFG